MEFVKNVPGAPTPVGPYSPAVKANGFLFVAGQIALDPASGKLVSGGIQEQTRRVLENLKAVLASQGLSFRDVAMATIFLTDISQGKLVNEIYQEYLDSPAFPARQALAVKDLPLGALVEISLIAAC